MRSAQTKNVTLSIKLTLYSLVLFSVCVCSVANCSSVNESDLVFPPALLELKSGIVQLELGTGFFLDEDFPYLHTAKHVLLASLGNKIEGRNDQWALGGQIGGEYIGLDSPAGKEGFRIREGIVTQRRSEVDAVVVQITRVSDLEGNPVSLEAFFARIKPLKRARRALSAGEALFLLGYPDSVMDSRGKVVEVNSWRYPDSLRFSITTGTAISSWSLAIQAAYYSILWRDFRDVAFGKYPSSTGFSGAPVVDQYGSVVGLHIKGSPEVDAYVDLPNHMDADSWW